MPESSFRDTLIDRTLLWLKKNPKGGSAYEIAREIGAKGASIGATCARLTGDTVIERFDHGGPSGGYIYVTFGDPWFTSGPAQACTRRILNALGQPAPVWVKEKRLARIASVTPHMLRLVLARLLTHGDVQLRLVDDRKTGYSRKSYRWGLGWEHWMLQTAKEQETVCV